MDDYIITLNYLLFIYYYYIKIWKLYNIILQLGGASNEI